MGRCTAKRSSHDAQRTCGYHKKECVGQTMSTDRPKREAMSLEEATVSCTWEISTIVEVLERKDLCTKQDLHDTITEFRRNNPRARIPETAFPEPYPLTETEEKIIDDILALLNEHGLTSHQSQTCLSG